MVMFYIRFECKLNFPLVHVCTRGPAAKHLLDVPQRGRQLLYIQSLYLIPETSLDQILLNTFVRIHHYHFSNSCKTANFQRIAYFVVDTFLSGWNTSTGNNFAYGFPTFVSRYRPRCLVPPFQPLACQHPNDTKVPFVEGSAFPLPLLELHARCMVSVSPLTKRATLHVGRRGSKGV